MPEPQRPSTSPRQKCSLLLTLGWFATTLLAVTCLLSMFVGSTLTLRLRWGLMEGKLGQGVLSFNWDKSSQFVNHPREFEYKQYRKLGVLRPWGENFDWQYVHFADGLQGLKGSLRGAIHLGAPALALMFLCLYYRRQLQRLFPAGSCPGCGYNVTGANHERCPECGQPLDQTTIKRSRRRIWWARARLAALLFALGCGVAGSIYLLGENSTPKASAAPSLTRRDLDTLMFVRAFRVSQQHTNSAGVYGFTTSDPSIEISEARRQIRIDRHDEQAAVVKIDRDTYQGIIFGPYADGSFDVVAEDRQGKLLSRTYSVEEVKNCVRALFGPPTTQPDDNSPDDSSEILREPL